MTKKKSVIRNMTLLTTLVISTFSLPVYADITVKNNTSMYGTGHFIDAFGTKSPCSSDAGSRGVAQPNQEINIPKSIINVYCGAFNCEADIFASKTCTGSVVGKAKIDPV